jgi:hypothetical protein
MLQLSFYFVILVVGSERSFVLDDLSLLQCAIGTLYGGFKFSRDS